MKIFRICGYGSGRSALVVRLVEEFNFRHTKVAVIKHSHKPFDMDKAGSDTWNLRQHGCQQTMIANRERWGLLCETPDLREPDPIALATHLGACDLVLAVGFDHTQLPGLEVIRVNNSREPLYPLDPLLQSVVTDGDVGPEVRFTFTHDAIEEVASHILIQAVQVSF